MSFEIDPVSAFVAFMAVLISGVTAYITLRHGYKKYLLDEYITGESLFVDLELSLKNNPNALRFHGVSLKEMEEIGINIEDFSYLLANFTTGCMHHRASQRAFNEIELTEYRVSMLESEHTRKAWPFIRKMMSRSPCRDKIDEKIKQIEDRIRKQKEAINAL